MSSPPLPGELRFWPELAALVSDPRFWSPARKRSRQPVLLIPGFLAGDASLTVMAGWLRRRGHRVRTSGIHLNVGCSGRDLDRLDAALTAFDEPVVIIGQSRGGTLARALAARHPDRVAALVTLQDTSKPVCPRQRAYENEHGIGRHTLDFCGIGAQE